MEKSVPTLARLEDNRAYMGEKLYQEGRRQCMDALVAYQRRQAAIETDKPEKREESGEYPHWCPPKQ